MQISIFEKYRYLLLKCRYPGYIILKIEISIREMGQVGKFGQDISIAYFIIPNVIYLSKNEFMQFCIFFYVFFL